MQHEIVIVLDFGGQYNQLIARRVRECGVYCEIWPYDTPLEKIISKNPKGIIFTGGPSSVYEPNAPMIDKELFEKGIPILGICYGNQLIAHIMGGKVSRALFREYGKTHIKYDITSPLFSGIPEHSVCWMSHTDFVEKLPEGFKALASTENCSIAAFGDDTRKIYGVQFHPEVVHTEYGQKIIENFLFNICNCHGDWKTSSFIEEKVNEIKDIVGNQKVVCALSGGVDSSVAAVLVHKAIGKNLYCIFVDHGLLRKGEAEEVMSVFKDQFDMNVIKVDAKDRFLEALRGVTDPEEKRKIIGREFIRVFEEEAEKLGDIKFLVQGTIYPDVVESGVGKAATIKSHHNVGGLPEKIKFEQIIEPLRELFKDEVRRVGIELGIPEKIVKRQPFPGPGLAIRIIGEVTEEKLDILREVDWIFRKEIEQSGLDNEIWQYFAVLTNMKSVGVMGDERTYDYTVALRAVTSIDGMTADWAKIPYEILERVSNEIVNSVKKVNRVVYDITSKPPATIEWE
ncbi:GMP synthase, large subunit [Caldicellulosiruptor kronotskyensis 2002]|uniref:GMP synthase [glutamine-hydrolyzing] n=1 Tax=Caldicellulosiruptor kronotskyensis (strain DSM 18902 / VKM B-2412 / 2002) TaxID=632348 RepID=E4SBL6_CALK2|nr:glutamine-hydrolyzing GMP synthase [Caldicellulosiruptor kronotskyensis]ADQ46139.1 GMP synthase, large subunit [Caldicellulosiruptor kronotskyensis 2002]